MKSYILNPEVPGELGFNIIIDTQQHPPIVEKLHFIFMGWLGDDLVECFPCFLISERLKIALEITGFTGFLIDECDVESSIEFTEMQPGVILPKFFWLKIDGNEQSDFALTQKHRLRVTKNAFSFLKRFNINYCDIETVDF